MPDRGVAAWIEEAFATVLPADPVVDVFGLAEHFEDLSELFVLTDVMAVDHDHVAGGSVRMPDDFAGGLLVHGRSLADPADAIIGGLVDPALGKLRGRAARYRSCPGLTSVIVGVMTRSHLILMAKRGKRDELLHELDRLEVFVAVRDQPGFLAASVLVPDDDSDRVLVEGSWASPEHFERWRQNPSRIEMLRSIRHLLADEPEVSVYHLVDTIS